MKEVCGGRFAEKPGNRESWRFAQVGDPRTGIPSGALRRAFDRIAELEAQVAKRPTGPRWTSIGPASIISDKKNALGPVIGRVADVAVDPGNTDHWLVGAAHGGIWETEDSGKKWKPLTDDKRSLAMGAIAFARSDSHVIYAGTGEAVFSRSTYGGEGLLKSEDGGRTWFSLNTSEFYGLAFSDLAVDPSNPNVLVAATTRAGVSNTDGKLPARGIFKSTRGGRSRTWLRTLDGEATDLEVNPRSFSQQYAGIGDICGDTQRNGLYRSTDAGDHWHLIAGPWMETKRVGRIELAIAPSNPDVLYVSVQRAPNDQFDGGDLLGLWRTDNAWATTPEWREIVSARNLEGSKNQSYCGFEEPSGGKHYQCWYTNEVIVDPDNVDILYAGGLDLWRYDGTDWARIGRLNTKDGTHVDQQTMAWAGRRLILGNDGGVWSTTDPSRGWDSLNEGLVISQVWRGSIDPNDDQVALAGIQDNGTARWTGTSKWRSVDGGDGAASAIAGAEELSATHWVVSSQRASFLRMIRGEPSDARGAIRNEPEETKPFITPLEKCLHDDDVFIAGTIKPWRTNNLFSSAKSGPKTQPDWKPNGPVLPKMPMLRAVAFAPSIKTCNTYAFGTLDGQLRLTKTGGGDPDAWTDLDPENRVPDRTITGLAFHPTDANILYVTLGGFDQGAPGKPGHVFKTVNALSARPVWKNITGSANLPHNHVAIDPREPRVIYVATDIGVRYTTDAGAHWRHMGPAQGLPNVAVSEVRVHPLTQRVFAFTFGRGVFVLDGKALAASGPRSPRPKP